MVGIVGEHDQTIDNESIDNPLNALAGQTEAVGDSRDRVGSLTHDAEDVPSGRGLVVAFGELVTRSTGSPSQLVDIGNQRSMGEKSVRLHDLDSTLSFVFPAREGVSG